MSWPPFSKNDNVSIPLDWTICIVDAVDEVVNAWNSKFGSGIVLPNVQLNG